jgi:hypothetical protein
VERERGRGVYIVVGRISAGANEIIGEWKRVGGSVRGRESWVVGGRLSLLFKWAEVDRAVATCE